MFSCRATLAALCLIASSNVIAATTVTYDITVNGASIASDSQSFSGSGYVTAARAGNNFNVGIGGGGNPITASATVQASATVPAQGTVTTVSQGNFTLLPPPSYGSFAPVLGGSVVLYFTLAGNLAGTASMVGRASVQMMTAEGPANGQGSRTLANQPGHDSTAFEVAVAFPPGFTVPDFVTLAPTLTLQAAASVPGGPLMTSSSGDPDEFTLVGFRVLDYAGIQITGFTMTPGGFVPELGPAAAGKVRAIEYYNASYGFYFVTSLPVEIADLDSGKTPGWQRTGQSFEVYAAAGSGRSAVCRFYGVFGVKSSHFYAPRGLGCETLLANPGPWQFEGDVFYAYLPDASGGCPSGNVPVYRLYNNGQGGAPNHRFTTSAATQVQMIGAGWIPEGTGIGVGMCSPSP